MYREHIIRVDRTITAHVNQAERHATLPTEANLSAKLLQLFVVTVTNVLTLVRLRRNCLIWRLGAVSFSKPPLCCPHLSSGLITCWSTNNENCNLTTFVWCGKISWHVGRRCICWKSAHSALLPHYNLGIFAVTMGGTPTAIGLCSQSVRRQEGRCWALIYFLSLSCLLMAHHSPGHIAHTHAHARTNILGCDVEAEAGEVDGEKGGKKENLFICFFSYSDITIKFTFLSLSLGLQNN